MEDPKFRRELLFFLLIYGLSRVFLLFIPASIPDIAKFDLTIEAALIKNNLDYPGLLQLQVAVFNLLFGGNLVALRLGLIIYEFGSIILLYKFAYLFQTQEFHRSPGDSAHQAIIIIYIFAFFPNTLFNFSDFSEVYSTFFVIAGLYTYYRNKPILMSICLGIGFLLEIYPIFFLVPILAFLLLKKKFIAIVKIAASFLLTALVGTLPFYFANPANFLSNYLGQFSRVPNAASLWEVIRTYSTNWSIISIPGVIDISPIGITFIVWFAAFIIYSFFYLRHHPDASKREIFLIAISFTFLLPVVFLSNMSRYVYFSFPLLCLFIDKKITIQDSKQHSTRISALVILPISIAVLVLWPLLNFIPLSDIVIDNVSLYSAFIFLLFILIPVLWVFFGKKIYLKRENFERPTIIQLLAFSFLTFLLQNLPIYVLFFDVIICCLGLVAVLWSVKKLIGQQTDNLLDRSL